MQAQGLSACFFADAMIQCSQVGACPAVFSFRQPSIPPEAHGKSLAFRFTDLAWQARASAPQFALPGMLLVVAGCLHALFP